MRHYPAPLTRAESDALADRIAAGLAERGWGLWALEDQATGRFLGYARLAPVPFDATFSPAVEVGWRLQRDAWGRGSATESAPAALGFTRPGNHLERGARSHALALDLGTCPCQPMPSGVPLPWDGPPPGRTS